MTEKTLAIIKPDGVANGSIGDIIKRIESEGIKIVSMKMEHMGKLRAEGFYYVHKEKPFFDSLIDFMISGPVVLMILSADDVIVRWRNMMGATNPAKAEKGTIRNEYGTSLEKNAVHGSDSPESAVYETSYFFAGEEICTINKEKVFKSGEI